MRKILIAMVQGITQYRPHWYCLAALPYRGFNPLTAGVAYMRVFIFHYPITYHFLNMLKIKYDINQQYLRNS